ncbi:hypothetical protein F5Y04DRAFT_241253 [Hypomontagnella monticulosa]|nr:hypothetical protein F5Y04DRAFT_241253 [Hypomontagnella monticulosa]
MLTRAVCQPTSRAGSLQTQAMASNALRPTNTSLLRAGHRQQTRSFRFGMWSSYLDPEFQRELRHRHRVLKHKYAESLNRKLSWDQGSLHGHPKAILKHMLRRYWNPAHARYGSRFVNQDELNARHQQHRATPADTQDWHMRTSHSWTSRRCNYNTSPPNYTWKSRLDEAMDRWTAQNPKDAAQTESTTANTQSTEDYMIDPITNRKVLRGSNGLVDGIEPSAADSFKSYRAQFSAFAPPKDGETIAPTHSDGPPPPAELKEYGQIKIDHDELLTPGEDAESRYPVIQSEEYALNHLPPEESAEQYDDLDRYQAYQRGELHDQAPEPTEKYEDLDKYKTYGAREAENLDTEASQDHDDLHEYKPYMHKENTKVEKQTEQYDDLGDYGPYKYQEDVKKDESPTKYDDLDKYKHYDDSGKPADDTLAKYEDLKKYESTDFQDSQAEDRPFQQYGDLDKYREFKHQELEAQDSPEQDSVSESLKEFDAKEQDPKSADSLKYGVADSLQNMDLNDYPIAEYPGSTPWITPSQEGYGHPTIKSESREALERSMANHNEASDAADREASANVKKSRMNFQESQPKLTGNYVRDFPEEFSGPWDRASRFSPESVAEIEVVTPGKLETSLDRQQSDPKLESTNQEETWSTRGTFDHHSRAQAEVDPYSKEPQGLETSYNKECNTQQTSPTFVKTYGGESKEETLESPSKDASQGIFQLKSLYFRDPEIDGRPLIPSSATDSKVEPNPVTEPTVYKVLAYDPTMQKINIAETTSIVPDQASPLTPAEVLLRLSNPTKFFPHFAPLQAEGFEIVSGSGDVLVFRQVRPSKPAHKETSSGPINPIDMMGKPAPHPSAAAFVSPTGFINYDEPPVEEEQQPQAPPFRSNIDVRREEPVFSGPKSTTSENARKPREKSLGKRALVGGAWVAGISYALGVVSEYFLTGGADGRGPTGF